MKRFAVIALAATISLMTTGCYKHILQTGNGGTRVSYDGKSHFFLGGLIGTEHVDVYNICGDASNATVELERTFVDGLLTAITSGIYSPRSVTVKCSSGRVSQVELSAKDIEEISKKKEVRNLVAELKP